MEAMSVNLVSVLTLATRAFAVKVPAVPQMRSSVHCAKKGRDVVVGDLLALPYGHVRPALDVVVRVHGVPARIKCVKTIERLRDSRISWMLAQLDDIHI